MVWATALMRIPLLTKDKCFSFHPFNFFNNFIKDKIKNSAFWSTYMSRQTQIFGEFINTFHIESLKDTVLYSSRDISDEYNLRFFKVDLLVWGRFILWDDILDGLSFSSVILDGLRFRRWNILGYVWEILTPWILLFSRALIMRPDRTSTQIKKR